MAPAHQNGLCALNSGSIESWTTSLLTGLRLPSQTVICALGWNHATEKLLQTLPNNTMEGPKIRPSTWKGTKLDT